MATSTQTTAQMWCEPGYCKNRGTCTVVNAAFKCTCPDGYIGDQCQDQDHHTIIVVVCVVVVVLLLIGAVVFSIWWCKKQAKKPPPPDHDRDHVGPPETMEMEAKGYI
ncbi:pro-epidermal growth factor [Lingula anatina]|uniref:Pro-epidermal growth factor n=1 Tax=Lingula anatina TaxID=7574 RepID=A0A1S3IN90_LINAN|nr:pro-epidermal growth factor [Lingula anatina]|eukprot:XP_013399667.1 pro-epidermal growth factor [Lingula anatina]